MRLLLEAAVRHKGLGPYHADRIRTWPPNVITKAFVFFKIETSAAYRVCAVGSAGLVITLYQSVLCESVRHGGGIGPDATREDLPGVIFGFFGRGVFGHKFVKKCA